VVKCPVCTDSISYTAIVLNEPDKKFQNRNDL